MIRAAIDKIQEIVREKKHVQLVEVNGRQYANREVIEVGPQIHEPRADTVSVATLSGLVSYLTSCLDGIDKKHGELLVRVTSPTRVDVLGPESGHFRERDIYAVADCSGVLPALELNHYVPMEQFLVMLRSSFLDAARLKPLLERYGVRMLGDDGAPGSAASSEPKRIYLAPEGYSEGGDVAYVAEMTAKVTTEGGQTITDDGVGQSVTIKTGVKLAKAGTIKNPVALIPCRTFSEIPQPMSEFLFRLREGGQFSLYEADGGAWRWQAMRTIKSELEFLLYEANAEYVQVIA